MRPLYVDRRGARFLVLLGLACLLLLLPLRAPAAGDSDEATNIRVYQKAHHSVINITNVAVDYDLFSTPYASESTGSGIVLDTHGHILTNHRVVDQAEKLEVTLGDGSKWPAELIGRLAHRGPPDRAGLRGGTVPVIAGNTRLLIGGDVIIAADGRPVTSGNDLNRFLRTTRPGESVVLTIVRNGARHETTVTLGEKPRR
jgi:S1-C subfamily serine protease